MKRVGNLLIEAGITQVQPAQFVLAITAGLVILFALIAQLTSSMIIAGSVCLCVGAQLLDSFHGKIKSEKLRSNLEWPKYLDSIHSAAWAGASIEQAILDSVSFAPPKLSWALLEFEKDHGSGLDFNQNLDNLKARLASPIADRFIEVTRLAGSSGGRGYLGALKSQALQLRLENATWSEVQVKQNWVLGTAKLAVLAPWLVLVLLGMRPETAVAFHTETGIAVLVIGLVASLLTFKFIKVLGTLPQRTRTLAF